MGKNNPNQNHFYLALKCILHLHANVGVADVPRTHFTQSSAAAREENVCSGRAEEPHTEPPLPLPFFSKPGWDSNPTPIFTNSECS